jgi:hypothetical protein
MRRSLVWIPMLLLLTCSMLPAEQPGQTSPEPSSEQPMVLLSICEEELTKLEQKSIEQVTKLESDFAERLRAAVQQAAADAVRPVLVELARVERQRRVWRAVGIGATVGAAGMFAVSIVALRLLIYPGGR